jgi:ATP-binding cassette subfamily E protein 1
MEERERDKGDRLWSPWASLTIVGWQHPQFMTDVVKPLQIDQMLDYEAASLCGGELQLVAIVLALGRPADVYFFDEPFAYLSSEHRIVAAKVIKRFILHAKKTAIIAEHNFTLASYLADRIIVFTGTPSLNCAASPPQPLLSGMNQFLNQLEITCHLDSPNFRPQLNNLDSDKDKEQKSTGQYFHYEPTD